MLHDLLGHDGVAEGFGHLVALLVQREPVGHNVAIGRAAKRATGLQHGRMEPSAVLVGTFQIDVCNAVFGPILTVTQNECVGRARVEPHVQNVKDLFPLVRVVVVAKETLFRALDVPAIRAFGLERLGDTGVHGVVAQQEAFVGRQRALLDEAGQRDAPGALTGQNPVRPRFDHRVQTVAAGLRPPFHLLIDRVQGTLTDGRAHLVLPVAHGLIDRRKPLRRVAIDDRCFRAPRMRVGVLDLAARQQPANLDQLVDDGLVRVAFLALAVQDVGAAEERQVGTEAAIIHDVIGDDLLQHAQITVKLVFLHTVRGRAVHKAGAFGVGHELCRAKVAQVVPFAVATFSAMQWVG